MAKHRPPSRLRYEAEHPTVTARIPRAVKEQLVQALRAQDLSFSEWVQAHVAGHEADAAVAYARGLDEGRRQGRTVQALLDAANFRASRGWDGGIPWFEQEAERLVSTRTHDDDAFAAQCIATSEGHDGWSSRLYRMVATWLDHEALPPLDP